jgi:hypothetical protein
MKRSKSFKAFEVFPRVTLGVIVGYIILYVLTMVPGVPPVRYDKQESKYFSSCRWSQGILRRGPAGMRSSHSECFLNKVFWPIDFIFIKLIASSGGP